MTDPSENTRKASVDENRLGSSGNAANFKVFVKVLEEHHSHRDNFT